MSKFNEIVLLIRPGSPPRVIELLQPSQHALILHENQADGTVKDEFWQPIGEISARGNYRLFEEILVPVIEPSALHIPWHADDPQW